MPPHALGIGAPEKIEAGFGGEGAAIDREIMARRQGAESREGEWGVAKIEHGPEFAEAASEKIGKGAKRLAADALQGEVAPALPDSRQEMRIGSLRGKRPAENGGVGGFEGLNEAAAPIGGGDIGGAADRIESGGGEGPAGKGEREREEALRLENGSGPQREARGFGGGVGVEGEDGPEGLEDLGVILAAPGVAPRTPAEGP